jgi:uncharacterized protein (DUF1778 family)
MREEKITIRVTDAEKRQLESAAEAEGRLLSDWIRRTLLTPPKKPVDRRRRAP